MKKILVDGKEITTNYMPWRHYPLCNGQYQNGYVMMLQQFGETDEHFFKRLVNFGYTRIKLAEVTTSVKGYHNTIAFCK